MGLERYLKLIKARVEYSIQHTEYHVYYDIVPSTLVLAKLIKTRRLS